MFRATMCPSSGEITVALRHLVFVTLCGWLSGVHPAYQTVIHTHSDKYHVSHGYSYFSWWWAHSRPKHVEKRNKHTKKNCWSSLFYSQDYTGMHGQQNIKFGYISVMQYHLILVPRWRSLVDWNIWEYSVLRTSREEHCISLVACCELATHWTNYTYITFTICINCHHHSLLVDNTGIVRLGFTLLDPADVVTARV